MQQAYTGDHFLTYHRSLQ